MDSMNQRERRNQTDDGIKEVHAIVLPLIEESLFKRLLDIVLSTFMMIVSAPVSLLIALGIKLEDGGPIFYQQERWGRGGKRFKVYKFRTMVPLPALRCRS
jgi:lipopolysaccharide/colanic/teichoic acid biosynthesis glycosyltransferase